LQRLHANPTGFEKHDPDLAAIEPCHLAGEEGQRSAIDADAAVEVAPFTQFDSKLGEAVQADPGVIVAQGEKLSRMLQAVSKRARVSMPIGHEP